MIVERMRKNDVLIRYRDEQGVRRTLTQSCKPFCYMEQSSIGKLSPPFTVLPDYGFKGLYGESLRRVEFENTDDLSKASKKVRTWRQTLRIATGCLSNTTSEVPMYEHRTWFFDMEWMMDSGAITIIVIQDSTDGEYVLFTRTTMKQATMNQSLAQTIPKDYAMLNRVNGNSNATRTKSTCYKTLLGYCANATPTSSLDGM